jgi:hypothetical protein
MTEHAVLIAVLILLLVSAVGGLFVVAHVATRRGFRMLRAMQIAETAVDVAVRYGGNAGPVKAVRKRLRDLQWEVGIEDDAGVPPVADTAAEDEEG